MSNPAFNSAEAAKSCGRALSVLELSVLLEELGRVVAELEESMTELALPYDERSRLAAYTVIEMARGA